MTKLPMTVSVIIPAFNAAMFIVEALDSVVSQTLPVLEIVVVDDGSADDTLELVSAWSEGQRFPVKIHAQANAGVSVARNTAINLASGEWVALLDADDIWLPNHVAELVAAARSYPQAITVFGDTVHFDQTGAEYPPFSRDKTLKCAVAQQGDYHLLDAEQFFAGTVPGLFLCPSATMVRRDVALAIGGFDATIRYIEDRDFFLRMALRGPAAFADCSISRNRIHDSNITHPRNAQRNAFYMIKLLRKMRDADEGTSTSTSTITSISPMQRRLLAQTLERTIHGYLYGASSKGLRPYWSALLDLGRLGLLGAAAFNPRSAARALIRSFRSTDLADA